MKKTLFALLVCSLILVSCTKYEETSTDTSDTSNISNVSDASQEESTSSEAEEEKTMFDFSLLSKEQLAEYITLGQYKGFETEKIVVEVTDEDFEKGLSDVLQLYGKWEEVKDKPIKEGDYVIIDYIGYLNGEAFEGGTGTDQAITIGEGKYIDGFEDGLIGVKSGESVSLNLTFPENYGKEELNGKAVVFEVSVKSVQEYVSPELSEEIIKDYTDEKATTIEEFNEYLKQELYDEMYRDKLNKSLDEYWQKIMDKATVIKYPDGIIDDYVEAYVDYYSQYAALYGVELEQFLGMKVEKFKEECQKNAEAQYKSNMVLYAAMYEEEYDYTIKEEKYNEWLELQAEIMGMSVEAFTQQYSEETLQATYIFETFRNYLYESRTEIEPTSSEESEQVSE